MFNTEEFAKDELKTLLKRKESHYLDFKAKEISGKDLQRHLVGFANADGGELYIGVEEVDNKFSERGFPELEDANQLIQTATLDIEPTIEGLEIEFLHTASDSYIVRFIIPKSPKLHYTSSRDCYLRLSAQSQKIKGDKVTKVALSKGFYRYEERPIEAVSIDEILDTGHLTEYLSRIGSRQAPSTFLKRNRLVKADPDLAIDRVTVGCALLFDDDPDEVLSTKASVKILRMKTTSNDYKREQLSRVDILSGPLESLVRQTESKILEIMEDASFAIEGVKFAVKYPVEAVHEVLVNAFLHRDYSLSDEIQVKIFDNRIEIRSPGRLPGGVTVDNILEAHFARNPNLVRLINKLPKPLNHDLGEGLDTAFRAMRSAGLVSPVITQDNDSVSVTLKHKKVASYEEIIMDYLEKNSWITNRIARKLTGEDSENRVKNALQRLRRKGLIEAEDPNASKFSFRYKKVNGQS